MSDFRSSRINRRGSQASPTHPSSGQRIHIPLGVGERVCVGGDPGTSGLMLAAPTFLQGPRGRHPLLFCG